LEALAANADPIAYCTTGTLNDVQITLVGMHNDCAGRFGGSVEHKLTLKLRRQAFFGRIWDVPWLIADVTALGQGIWQRSDKP
jgi:hypothetical protein